VKRFIVTSEGSDRFGLAKLAQAYIDEPWLADHMTRGGAGGFWSCWRCGAWKWMPSVSLQTQRSS
jgi:hypothetical protein